MRFVFRNFIGNITFLVQFGQKYKISTNLIKFSTLVNLMMINVIDSDGFIFRNFIGNIIFLVQFGEKYKISTNLIKFSTLVNLVILNVIDGEIYF